MYLMSCMTLLHVFSRFDLKISWSGPVRQSFLARWRGQWRPVPGRMWSRQISFFRARSIPGSASQSTPAAKFDLPAGKGVLRILTILFNLSIRTQRSFVFHMRAVWRAFTRGWLQTTAHSSDSVARLSSEFIGCTEMTDWARKGGRRRYVSISTRSGVTTCRITRSASFNS